MVLTVVLLLEVILSFSVFSLGVLLDDFDELEDLVGRLNSELSRTPDTDSVLPTAGEAWRRKAWACAAPMVQGATATASSAATQSAMIR